MNQKVLLKYLKEPHKKNKCGKKQVKFFDKVEQHDWRLRGDFLKFEASEDGLADDQAH